jgi:endonuclease/exonuclease/phosphatase family metal-dependent hydrolase
VVLRLRLNRARQTILALLLLSVVAVSATTAELGVEFLAQTVIPGDLEVDRTRVGGLSGLTYDPGCDLFYAISDDRGSFAPPRFYTLKIRIDGEHPEVTVLEATLLRDADGAPFLRGDIDPEALALTKDGTLFLASEGVPHRGIQPLVARFSLDGSIQGTQGLPEHYLLRHGGGWGVRDNLGFEGLDVSPDGSRLFVAAENALIQDGPAADLEVPSPTRLLVVELPGGRPIAEHLYEVGPVPDEPNPSTAFRTNGISEILALDNHRLLVLERSFSVGVGNRVRLYLVDLEGAEDIREIGSLRGVDGPNPVPLAKTLVADIGDFGVEPDNIEGMALGPVLPDGRRQLVLISDNNFQPSEQISQILLFAVSGVERPMMDRLEAGIHEIQGAGHVSPLVGRCVSRVDGVVTAILGSRSGQAFWIQSPKPGDDDPRTSEGLLVTALDGLPKIDVGYMVRLEGRVEERSWGFELPVTRLVASGLEAMDGQGPTDLPEAVSIGEGGVTIPQPDIASSRLETFDPAQFAADAFESLEGMLVRVEDPVVVGPTSRYGEFVVLPAAGRSAALRTTSGGIRLLENNINPQRIIIDDRLVAEPPDLKVGDTLAAPVEGVLHYSFGSYKVLNTGPLPEVRGHERVGGRTSLTGGPSHLTIATFNLENVSALSEVEKLDNLAAVVAGNLGAPDIVAVQEVQDDTGPEDDGTVTAERTLELLVEAIESAGGPRYETRSIDPENNADGGQPGANIRNAFLFNPARVEFVDREGCSDGPGVAVADGSSRSCSPGLVDPGNPAFRRSEEGRGGSRKPLVGEFRFAGKSLFVVNLHLASKGGDDPVFGRRQPRIEATSRRRTEQARVVADFVNEVERNDPAARVVVLGDLNDFENSDALRALEKAGLEDLVVRLPLESRYSYVYLGNSQVLDHVLVSKTLAEGAEVEIAHVNADFPAAVRASDHDPVIVRLSIGQ